MHSMTINHNYLEVETMYDCISGRKIILNPDVLLWYDMCGRYISPFTALT